MKEGDIVCYSMINGQWWGVYPDGCQFIFAGHLLAIWRIKKLKS